ncbi:RfbX Membrane protein involved in the export of O-antigen and teichoic acid [Rhabdaerophilaceae bacterium]
MSRPVQSSVPELSRLRELVWRALPVIAIAVAGSAIALGLHVLIARVAGPATYAAFAFLVSLINVIAMIALLGYDIRIPQELPAQLAAGAHGSIKKLLGRALLDSLVVGAVAALVAGAFLWPRVTSGEFPISDLMISALVILALILARLGTSIATATGQLFAGMWPERLLRDSIAIAVILLLVAISGTPSLSQIMLASLSGAAATCLAVLLGQTQMLPLARAMFQRSHDGAEASGHDRPTTLRLALASVASYIMMRSPLLVGAVSLPFADLALFSAGIALAELAGFGVTILAFLLMPDISRAQAAGRSAHVARLFARGWVLSVVATLASTAFLLMFQPIFAAAFGAGFERLSEVLLWLCLAQVARSFAGNAVQVMNARGQEGLVLAIQSVGAILTLVLVWAASAISTMAIGIALTVGATYVSLTLFAATILHAPPRFRAGLLMAFRTRAPDAS